MKRCDLKGFIRKAELLTSDTGHKISIELEIDSVQLDLQFVLNSLSGADTDNQIDLMSDASLDTPLDKEDILLPEDIYEDVEQALKDYYQVSKLCKNPLLQKLDLSRYHSDDDNDIEAPGLAFRRFLDEALDTMTGDFPGTKKLSQREQWRIEHYLHLCYREEIPCEEIIKWIPYSKATIYRFRKEQINDAARLMIDACRSQKVSSI